MMHPEITEEWAIVLGLHRGPWEKILADGKRQTLLSFLVFSFLAVLGLPLGRAGAHRPLLVAAFSGKATSPGAMTLF